MSYLDGKCIICGKDYAIYGADGFCDDCLMDGDDELHKELEAYYKVMS